MKAEIQLSINGVDSFEEELLSVTTRDGVISLAQWGAVEVHVLYTPYDLMIVPARSSVLAGAASVTRVGVAVHRFMITDARALDAIAGRLRG